MKIAPEKYSNMSDVEGICRAIEFVVTSYRAIPHFPQNDDVREALIRQYDDLCEHLKEALK